MRILLLGGGGPAGVNAARALTHAGHHVIAADSNPAHLEWAGLAAEPLHMPDPTVAAVNHVQADVVIAQPDPLVAWLSAHRDSIHARMILPSDETIRACQDKVATGELWHHHRLRAHPPVRILDPLPDHLHLAKDEFGLPFWLRATRGAGARGGTLVESLQTGYHWIRYWQERQPEWEWVAEEYLPGRDYAWASLWYKGDLVTSFARERLEYIYPHLTPDGLTGTPVVARAVHDDQVNAVAEQAVKTVEQYPHGFMCVDLREDAGGTPRPTEINAGRGFTTLGLWSLYGTNFYDLAVRHAMDGRSWWLNRPDMDMPPKRDALPAGLTLTRHIDIPHAFTRQKVAA